MICKFENLGERITCGAAASMLATLVMASVGLLFSAPGQAAAPGANLKTAAIVLESQAGA